MIQRKKLYAIFLGVALAFSWFWTEGFGISPNYAYGKISGSTASILYVNAYFSHIANQKN